MRLELMLLRFSREVLSAPIRCVGGKLENILVAILGNSNSEEYYLVTLCWSWPKRTSKSSMKGGYPHMTEEYKKFQEVEIFFQQCIDIAMCSSEKLEFIKERCNEMKDALVNWVPTTSDNVPPSQTTENTQVGGGTLILNPVVTTTRGRPRSNRYISRAEERSQGRVRCNHTKADDIEGGGEGQGRGHRRRARGRGVGRGRGQGRVGGRGNNGHGDGMTTQGNEEARVTQENEGAFIFDLNEDADWSAQF
ncbi:hypothetical protein ACS0TY_006518 [Phlomoides rotata]